MAAPRKHVCLTEKSALSNKILTGEAVQIAKKIISSRKNANQIVDLIELTKSTEEEIVRGSIEALKYIFASQIKNGDLRLDPKENKCMDEDEISDHNKEDHFHFWLRECYGDCIRAMTDLLLSPSSNIQELALSELMCLITAECNNPHNIYSENVLPFPASTFEIILLTLLSPEQDNRYILEQLETYLKFDDVRHFTMKFALRDLKENQTNAPFLCSNLFCLLENLNMPPEPENGQLTNLLCTRTDLNLKNKITSYKEEKKIFTFLWLEFLKQEMSPTLYKKVLITITDKVIPFMTSPLLLSDFLTQSFDIGGVTSLLALNGIFILMHQYNLEYPDFYTKLYSLLDPGVFYVKYKARFFFLTDLFLTSTHLPAYIVAAFAKKMSRLSLNAPPCGLTIVIPFIFNLINRHPNCRILIHCNSDIADISQDPYNMNEKDLKKCNALNSSLWELKALQEHYHHSVSKVAHNIDKQLPKGETDLSSLLETTVGEMFDLESKKKVKEDVSVTYEPPKGMFGTKDNSFIDLWTL